MAPSNVNGVLIILLQKRPKQEQKLM